MRIERKKRMEEVLSSRQSDLVIVLENVVDPHNIGAVMRSADSVGVQEIFIINTTIKVDEYQKKRSTGSAELWLNIYEYTSVKQLVGELKRRKFKLWATHLGTASISLYEVDMTQPIALIFGNERHGLSEELLGYCDGNFIIPQIGMIKSLNISVACALSLYEANRQRSSSPTYTPKPYLDSEKQAIMERWCLRYEQNSKPHDTNKI